MIRSLLLALFVSSIALVLTGCQYEDPDPYTSPIAVVGGTLDPDQLNRGREAYVLYCYACHGMEGDGDGPAAYGLRPAPRDFRNGMFKFAGVADGLPHDDDIKRIIKEGLNGTAMLPWEDIPDTQIDDIVQYLKVLSYYAEDEDGEVDAAGWMAVEDNEIGERAEAGEDPWGTANAADAIKRGQDVYHGQANCQQCHAGYITKPEIKAAYKATNNGKEMTAEFRADLYEPLIQLSEYTVPVRAPLAYKALTCTDDEDCTGDGTMCIYGKCSRKLKVLPPDFTFNDLRSVRPSTELQDLFRIVAHGIQGSGMPAWKLQGINDKDLWALSYYVQSLTKLKDTSAALELKKRLKAQE
jgi:mono/diheme cytochrome c family protein